MHSRMKEMKNSNWPLFMAQSLLLFLVISFVGCHSTDPVTYDFAPLGFPFAQPGHVTYIAAFGIPNWSGSEPHNGIDLVIDENLDRTRIISPTVGVVTKIEMSENQFSHPAGQLILTITIRVNSEWEVSLVLEPGTSDPETKTAQRNAMLLAERQTVAPGDPVADLLVGELGHPHLHFMVRRGNATVCAYAHSSSQAQGIFEEIVRSHPNSYLPNGRICYVDAF